MEPQTPTSSYDPSSIPPPPTVPGPASTLTSSPKNKGPLVALAAALVVALVLGISFWFASTNTAKADSGEMDAALAALDGSISTAEKSMDRAKSAKDELAMAAETSGDAAATELADDAEEVITQFAVALDDAKQVRNLGETQEPTNELVERIEDATSSLDDLTVELDEITETVEETTEELQTAPSEMNLEQIAQGDFSSIVGTWVGVDRTHAEVSASTIDWYLDGELYARSDGLTYTVMKGTKDVKQGQELALKYKTLEANSLALYYDYYTANVPSGHAAKGIIDFYKAGAPMSDGQASDESLPRIVWFGQNDYGRADMYTPFADFVMYQTDNAPSKPAATEKEPESKPAGCVAPVEGAYPCAGGPIPEGAKQLPGFVPQHTGTSAQVASFKTPSDNIHCSVEKTKETICLVWSWDASTLPGYSEPVGGAGGVTLGASGPPDYSIHSGAPIGGSRPGGMGADTVPYGTVWYFGDFVFASEEAGLTFWNANTGYGALINKSGFYPFGPK